MWGKTGKTAILSLLFLSVSVTLCLAGGAPRLNHGKKWNIAYYEGGAFSDYVETMRTLIMGLMASGWIDQAGLPGENAEAPLPYWKWLGQCSSPYLAFKSENGYSAGWDEQKRVEIREKMVQKLQSGAVDLVIAMGTWAGQDLANDRHSVPVMVLSTSDPIKAGIIKSAENSGFDHVTARVDPGRYKRQIIMFSRIAEFQTLGIAYENTPDGKVYAALETAMEIAQKRGFKIVLCEVADTNTDAVQADESCLECYRKLAARCDAVYVTALPCVDRQPEAIAEIFRTAKVPSFSMLGSRFVKDGMMLSISSDSGYAELGRHNAMNLGKILNGTKPGDLSQVFEDPLKIAVNMETVRQISFKMPAGILKIASEIYEQ